MTEGNVQARVGYIVRSYPRLSQTFILNEILALEHLGHKLEIFAITDPQEPIVQSQVADVKAPVQYLDAAQRRRMVALVTEHLLVMLASPRRYFRTFQYILRHKDIDSGYTASSRYTCFTQAVYLSRLLQHKQQRGGNAIRHLHAHFAHDPTLIAQLTHMLTGISYSFTAHARDLLQVSRRALAERAEEASTVVTCCGPNVSYLQNVLPARLHGKIRLIHHGVDLERFQPAVHHGQSAEAPLILSVGRLVEKKGFPDLLLACQRLKQAGFNFRCEIYGDGPLRGQLSVLIEQLGLDYEVMLAGSCTQQQLVPLFQRATAFALTPFVTDDGDRDGIPNVLFEAMACGLPIVTTAVGGITELVTHDHNGLLVEPHNAPAIAAELIVLLGNETKRKRLGEAARRTVVEHFDVCLAARRLASLFDGVIKEGAPSVADHSFYLIR